MTEHCQAALPQRVRESYTVGPKVAARGRPRSVAPLLAREKYRQRSRLEF
jgi:hypothetical protein